MSVCMASAPYKRIFKQAVPPQMWLKQFDALLQSRFVLIRISFVSTIQARQMIMMLSWSPHPAFGAFCKRKKRCA
eukprot:12176616-Karenia_brevis.AAC.1